VSGKRQEEFGCSAETVSGARLGYRNGKLQQKCVSKVTQPEQVTGWQHVRFPGPQKIQVPVQMLKKSQGALRLLISVVVSQKENSLVLDYGGPC